MNNLIEWLIELRCVDVALNWGEVSEWEGESERSNEWLWCMGAENDHFVNVRSSLARMLTAQFDRLEVSLAWNCIEYVFADQLSSAIIHHDLIWYDIWFQVWIWFEHPYVLRLRKSFYATQCTIKFLMFHISTRLRFKRAHAKSQIPCRSHAQGCIDVFVNPVITAVIYKFLSHHQNITI